MKEAEFYLGITNLEGCRNKQKTLFRQNKLLLDETTQIEDATNNNIKQTNDD